MNALVRINVLESCKITTDDVDISIIGLDQLRLKLSITPQDPVLFKDIIRQSLDPFKQYSHVKLWDASKRSCLLENYSYTIEHKDGETMHKFHSDQHTNDEGENFSLGSSC